jgi:hypothetical protein
VYDWHMINFSKIILGIIGGVIFCIGLLVFIFTNFIYGHVGWINTNTFQINIGLATVLSIFIFALGLVILLKNAIKIFDSSPRILFIIRKMIAFILLGNLVYVLFYAGLFGLFLWLMFFNVALIFCLYLLFTKHNGYFFGIFFFILGLAYAVLPIFPGPFVLMPEFFTMPDFSMGNFADKMLLFHVVIFKLTVALSGCFILFTAFFKKTPQQ